MKRLLRFGMAMLLCAAVLVQRYPLDIYSMPEDLVLAQAEGRVLLYGQELSLGQELLYVNGRLYLPLCPFTHALGGDCHQVENGWIVHWQGVEYQLTDEGTEVFPHSLVYEDAEPYAALIDLTSLFELWPVFDTAAQTVDLYDKKVQQEPVVPSLAEPEAAYLRLEDIAANPGNGNFTSANLERLRAMADYLFRNGQQFYIAWIPVYKDPLNGVENDLSKDFNFYNTEFIYTLDDMVQHGGHIVLHGLTHQERDTVSSIGTEFGPDTPFSEAQIRARMEEAKRIARFLGYDDSVFEFPHYSTTPRQLEIAESLFSVIYQQSFEGGPETIGQAVTVERLGHDVTYLPTPFNYVAGKDAVDDMLFQFDTREPGTLASLFYHPYLEYDYIQLQTDGHTRGYTYDPQGVLPQLVRTANAHNLVFSYYETE